jgi:hypothetical protein
MFFDFASKPRSRLHNQQTYNSSDVAVMPFRLIRRLRNYNDSWTRFLKTLKSLRCGMYGWCPHMFNVVEQPLLVVRKAPKSAGGISRSIYWRYFGRRFRPNLDSMRNEFKKILRSRRCLFAWCVSPYSTGGRNYAAYTEDVPTIIPWIGRTAEAVRRPTIHELDSTILFAVGEDCLNQLGRGKFK